MKEVLLALFRGDVGTGVHDVTRAPLVKDQRLAVMAKLYVYNMGVPFERIAIDVTGLLSRTEKGNRYILVIMEYFTKLPEVYPTENQEATTIADILINRITVNNGIPQRASL